MSQIFGNQNKSYLEGLLRAANNSVKSIGYQQITVSGLVQNLTIPTGATYAVCIIESTTTSGIVARTLQNSASVVAAGTGMPVKDGTVFSIADFANLNTFQIIQEGAYVTLCNIEYFK